MTKLPIDQTNMALIQENLDYCFSEGGWQVQFSEIGKKRSLDANALYHVFIREIANHFGYDTKSVELECKRDFGLSVLLAVGDERSDKLKWCLDKLGYWDRTPSQQKQMMEMLSITSVMTSKEMREVITYMQTYYRDKGLFLESNR